ncbi:MAG TPA: DNA replication and repair protein RecF [Myxococcota bacterium]|nr:DNA replication and repair protein RecF [Myxococcota bacterium]HOD06571.1 DNA replication and repair protein RecF [Myxococcota bacterium]HPB50415.1 DNA replication and repair protein RecF [Myxococcota bacterium]HQP95331.1 DNA replication and repair protein RecF [Myxococcota bacterium]
MKVASIEIHDFRNIGCQVVSFGPRVNLVVGSNGQGKTNLVEAIAFLSWLKSFRSPRTADLLRAAQGVSSAGLAAVVEGAKGRHEIRAEIGRGWRRVIIDGSPACSSRDTIQILSVSCLSPDDPAVLEGGPDGRRMLLDRFAAQLEPSRTIVFSTWSRLVRERNVLLRNDRRDNDLLDAVEQNMSSVGAEYLMIRLDTIDRIASRLPAMMNAMTDTDLRARVGLSSRWLRGAALPAASSERASFLSAALGSELALRRDSDAILGYTTAGPGVDDVDVQLQELKVRGHASRGQKKVLMLAWKAAEAAEISAVRSEEPVLVLDDALADLDPLRQEGVVSFLRGYGGQSFITSAAAEGSVFRDATVIRASGGTFSVA